ncbi:lipopolysaccharide export system permease protein [Paucidesulfovibrio gracilis DSM 16080]|uniref:Lipopolysaccharide export system permease protein n=1 Tax=Paucidesulfovibrio gracilis DSM 16080 TaxID=1121449 RepID=A0A1T4WNB8_9BACT|nr:LptF/LptG family permease [Paucidesulfovibrio gracilis]SKA78814.1 lipopolysaccharide export system permease protein [Paucidesulfovibrio gracilis DSM 16080]
MIGILRGYLVRQNLFLLGVCLSIGIGVYLLADMFDRLDDFVDAGLGVSTVAAYYGYKLPLIISQILPAVFFLSFIIQLGLLARSREMLALRAGGCSFGRLVRFFFIYAVLLSLVQLSFSQFVGAWGENQSRRIWKEDVRKKQLDELVMRDIWFRSGEFIVHSEEIAPGKMSAKNVTVYEFDLDSRKMIRVLNAERVKVEEFGWRVFYPVILDTQSFSSDTRRSMLLPVMQDVKALAAVNEASGREKLPLLALGKAIKDLEASGSNVERLRTIWHAKISYAFTIACMALMALALNSCTENMYLGVGLGLALIFAQYGLHMVGVAAGQQGVVPPLIGAWVGNAVFGTLSLFRLLYVGSPLVERVVSAPFRYLAPPVRDLE